MTLDKTSLPAINTKDTRTMTLNILIVAHFLGDCRMTALHTGSSHQQKGISSFNFHCKSRDLLHDAKSSHQRLVTKRKATKKISSLNVSYPWCKKSEVLKCATCVSNLKTALEHATFPKSKIFKLRVLYLLLLQGKLEDTEIVLDKVN